MLVEIERGTTFIELTFVELTFQDVADMIYSKICFNTFPEIPEQRMFNLFMLKYKQLFKSNCPYVFSSKCYNSS